VNRLTYAQVGAAATEDAVHCRIDLVVIRMAVFVQQRRLTALIRCSRRGSTSMFRNAATVKPARSCRLFGAAQIERVPKHPQQRRVPRNIDSCWPSVNNECDSHGIPPQVVAWFGENIAGRSVSLLARARRHSARPLSRGFSWSIFAIGDRVKKEATLTPSA
jgi:hypothetical protein